jgi:hypothetical protein
MVGQKITATFNSIIYPLKQALHIAQSIMQSHEEVWLQSLEVQGKVLKFTFISQSRAFFFFPWPTLFRLPTFRHVTTILCSLKSLISTADLRKHVPAVSVIPGLFHFIAHLFSVIASIHIQLIKLKVKMFLCFNWATRFEGVLGSGGIAPLIIWPRY